MLLQFSERKLILIKKINYNYTLTYLMNFWTTKTGIYCLRYHYPLELKLRKVELKTETLRAESMFYLGKLDRKDRRPCILANACKGQQTWVKIRSATKSEACPALCTTGSKWIHFWRWRTINSSRCWWLIDQALVCFPFDRCLSVFPKLKSKVVELKNNN